MEEENKVPEEKSGIGAALVRKEYKTDVYVKNTAQAEKLHDMIFAKLATVEKMTHGKHLPTVIDHDKMITDREDNISLYRTTPIRVKLCDDDPTKTEIVKYFYNQDEEIQYVTNIAVRDASIIQTYTTYRIDENGRVDEDAYTVDTEVFVFKKLIEDDIFSIIV